MGSLLEDLSLSCQPRGGPDFLENGCFLYNTGPSHVSIFMSTVGNFAWVIFLLSSGFPPEESRAS